MIQKHLRTYARSCLTAAALLLAAGGANAATYTGHIMVDAMYTLIHAGSAPNAENAAEDWLWFDAGQSIQFEFDGAVITSRRPQRFTLSSNNGATAIFMMSALELSTNSENGRPFGSMDYSLDGVSGTFTFDARMFSEAAGFNSIVREGDRISTFLWGGDTANNIGLDLAFNGAVVPVPGALLLFASGLLGLGGIARRK